jgi:hypothetical protein
MKVSPQVWRALSRVHYWASLLFGVQVLIWIGTGLYFASVPIGQVRGEHLRAETAPIALSFEGVIAPEMAAAAANADAAEMTLKVLDGQPVYLVRASDGRTMLVDAVTGEAQAGVTEPQAQRLAVAAYAGAGSLQTLSYLAHPPSEYGREGPAFAAVFGPQDPATLYVNAATGQARVVRTDQWRLYDFLWGLHIMDWADRENFNSLHLIGFAAGGLVLSVAGAGLAAARLLRRRRHSHSGAPSPLS